MKALHLFKLSARLLLWGFLLITLVTCLVSTVNAKAQPLQSPFPLLFENRLEAVIKKQERQVYSPIRVVGITLFNTSSRRIKRCL